MKYLEKSFSVAMPGRLSDWPWPEPLGRYCDHCHSKGLLMVPDTTGGDGWRLFDPAKDSTAWCSECHELLGDYEGANS